MSIVTKTVRIVKTLTRETVRTERTIRTTVRAEARPDPLLVDVPGHGPYVVRTLLTDGDSNPKLRKSNDAGPAYRTWGLSLAPALESGYQTCSSSSAGCRGACLYKQGRGRTGVVALPRVAKTLALFEQRAAFMAMLRWELSFLTRLGDREGFVPALRLNMVSDLMWERLAPWIFADFPGVQCYDYTKHAARMLRYCRGGLPATYHLTFSRSETNEPDCLRVLQAGGTVAVVFDSRDLPGTWHGYPIINGDETDLRFTDPRGHVVGLYAKGTARHDTSGFVVPTADRRVPLVMAS
jgi:hypothetical protein